MEDETLCDFYFYSKKYSLAQYSVLKFPDKHFPSFLRGKLRWNLDNRGSTIWRGKTEETFLFMRIIIMIRDNCVSPFPILRYPNSR